MFIRESEPSNTTGGNLALQHEELSLEVMPNNASKIKIPVIQANPQSLVANEMDKFLED